jgi:tRNA (guanine37-N1)-methyltransferase
MKISILTLFPDMFQGPFDYSIIKRAREKGLVEINLINIRDFGIGKHKVVDDTPYGGGVGMVMRVDVLHEAIIYAKSSFIPHDKRKQKVILLSAGGKTFHQQKAGEYAKLDHLILICGHYEGIDDRIQQYIDEEISVGDFVLTGGEIPAMLITDAVTRLIGGVITEGAVEDESFSLRDEGRLLEYPHFTKPQEYDKQSVPEILLNGDHKKIKEWRLQKALEKTKKLRPDLLTKK